MKRALLLGVTCIGVAVTAAAWGDSPTITAQVPHDRNVSLAQATRTIVNPPGGSPAPTAPLVTAAHRLPPSPAGFACDVQGCEFTRMPLYNQTNPNLAFVDVPASVYAAEARKVTGQLVPDPAARHDAIVVSTPGVANATELDPYYESWLPLGSMVGDQGSLGYWLSATCGPTAESMALMAAMAAMRP
ncbi:MAG TPA: hypothetical protein VIF15_14940, partial [Polyangiaceae bacterium]